MFLLHVAWPLLNVNHLMPNLAVYLVCLLQCEWCQWYHVPITFLATPVSKIKPFMTVLSRPLCCLTWPRYPFLQLGSLRLQLQPTFNQIPWHGRSIHNLLSCPLDQIWLICELYICTLMFTTNLKQFHNLTQPGVTIKLAQERYVTRRAYKILSRSSCAKWGQHFLDFQLLFFLNEDE